MKAYHKIIITLSMIASIYIARLTYLQLLTDRYALNAANTSIKIEYDIPQRGVIFDRNGKILVGNQPSYEITYTQQLIKPDFDSLSFCKLLQMTPQEYSKRIEQIKKESFFSKMNPMTFKKDLSREQIARIQERIFKYPAFSIVSRPQRRYEIDHSGNLLGYTSQVNSLDLKSDSVYYLPGDIIGKNGVEKAYENDLRGKKGMSYIQKDIRLRNIGKYKDGSLDKPVVSGKDLVLTIDYELQKIAEEMLVNKRGAIVALDPKNGEILAMASAPDINPQLFTGPNKNKNLYHLQMDSVRKPMFDRSVQAAYPPGSPFKLMTALSAYQMRVINDSTRFTCHHGFRAGRFKIGCHCGTGYPIGMEKAIEKSCNNFFSRTFLAIAGKYPNHPSKGIDEWKEIMNSFGLGVYMNNDLAFGSKGKIPSGNYYEKRYGENWKPMQSIFNGMGQGEILLTPMQMAVFTSAIANKGFFYTPHIVKTIDGKPNSENRFYQKNHTKVDPKYFNVVIKGMQDVMIGGTGRSLRSKEFTQLGKTGTAQVPGGRDNSIFTLIAPAENPKIVVVAVIENAGFGATWAGPASTVIAERYLLGEIKRKNLYTKMTRSSFNAEYNRQWINHLKKIGKYVAPDFRKIQRSKDSLTLIQLNKTPTLNKEKIDSFTKLLALDLLKKKPNIITSSKTKKTGVIKPIVALPDPKKNTKE